MSDLDDLKLSNGDRKYLEKFERSIERIHTSYIIVGILLCLAIFGLIIGVMKGKEEGFFILIMFTQMAFNLFTVSQKYKKLYRIILHLEHRIKEMQK